MTDHQNDEPLNNDENAEEQNSNQEQTIMGNVIGEIENLKNENKELKDRLLRSMAEIDNVRKRGEKQAEESSKYAISSFAKSLLNVIDNLTRASQTIPKEGLEDNQLLNNISIGIDITLKEFSNVLQKFQVKEINPEIGEPFDHNFHQAVSHIPSNDFKSGAVIEVLQSGYVINDRLLRPAMVAVAK